MMLDPHDPAEVAKAEEVNARMVARAIGMDGTCTGEHGVGLHKMDFLVHEHGEEAIDAMRTLKRAFDPKNIMNPGKIIRWQASA
jgi:D-lactate dehydrogenase (cytochrome)